MYRVYLPLALALGIQCWLPAQTLSPTALRSPEEHVAFFDTIRNMHQEMARRSSPVISEYGWESPEHLALRDSTDARYHYLRRVVNEYLDLYGFPAKSDIVRKKRKVAQAELIRRMRDVMKLDSMQRDSVLKLVGSKYAYDVTAMDTRPTVMLILDTEPDFSKRCENISWLRFEWEEENLSTQSFLAYLRHTYAAKHGHELDIATGSTERERIYMHARELSGCWGN